MIKRAPSVGRLAAMAAFALSVFGLLMFLWLAFGGPIPLRPEGYRIKAGFPEAAALVDEADVRIAGVNVGKVKSKELDEGGARTIAEIELDSQYAPVPRDTRAMLRQKTLLGETYVELSTGDRSKGMLGDGETLPSGQVAPTVEIDEIFSSFDRSTREAFRVWMRELAKAIGSGRGRDLNDALGNLVGFAVDGATLLEVVDEQGLAVRRLVRNTGEVFGALTERRGALRRLITGSHDLFEATASRDEALAETFEILPTFLDESRATLARLERFSRRTHPLVRNLRAPAEDLGPTVRDLGDLAPDLEDLFRDLDLLRVRSRRPVPQLERVLEGLQPLVEELHPFFLELNPILSYLNYHQATVAGFLSNAAADFSGFWAGEDCDKRITPECVRVQTQVGMIDPRSFEKVFHREDWERGNAYLAPNALVRSFALGTIESFRSRGGGASCSSGGPEQALPHDADGPPPADDPSIPSESPLKAEARRPPCLVAPRSLWDGRRFPFPHRGQAPLRSAPRGLDGQAPARDPRPGDPRY
jgi:phospholipid/cholesterol/gamma-HCH transport system substrate-binding protein